MQATVNSPEVETPLQPALWARPELPLGELPVWLRPGQQELSLPMVDVPAR